MRPKGSPRAAHGPLLGWEPAPSVEPLLTDHPQTEIR
jgi:hypothetical protein